MVEGDSRPIGMFDSGVGGLTVARSVIDLMPHEDLVYFGDTARCPYGPRPPEEVARFSSQIMNLLMEEKVKLVVIACNSAASAVLPEAYESYDLPIVSVIEPGVRAAIVATRNRRIGLIGTQATVQSSAYDEVVARTRENVSLLAVACPQFVDFVERGDTTSEELIAVAAEYLEPLKQAGVDTLILGCTHYPLLTGVIQYVMGDTVVLVSSAEATANETFIRLRESGMLTPSHVPGALRFLATSEKGIFGELGSRFLGPELETVEYRAW